ncbi:Thiol-disulfide isomerase or thioredoxin [Chitinophaga rupis]|uniref:Thiol-disulfide isomerase or thioredoxin n=1 Tax=Chitinophaga rupis TaxID=573321 RepID=A0A1H8DSF3_9BACT|nr:TlpA disulfide reductase family protein [Chitinophaga rupis]SEN10153.1 Thiol-disulfide isomerase or thioredoxin [Chitinophaga rupis]
MNKLKMALAAPLILLASVAGAQQATKFFPERPIAGDSVTISYNPEHTMLKGLAPVSGVVWLYRHNNWETHDLDLQMTDTGWVAKYLLPDSAAFMVANFMANGITDKGGKPTYAVLLSDRNGRQMPTSYAAWAFLRLAIMEGTVPHAVEDSARIADDVGVFWMNNELKYYPGSRRHIMYGAMSVLKHSGAPRANTVILREIDFISKLPDATEAELMNASKAYRNLLGDAHKADSMDQVIINRFPNGITARDKMIYKMFRAGENERLSLWNTFVQQFPLQKFMDVDTETDAMYYEKVYRGVVYQQVMRSKNLEILDQMMDLAPLICLTEFHRLLIVNALAHDQIKLAEAFPYSKKLVEHIEAYTTNKHDSNSRFYSPRQWKQYVLNLAVPAFMGHAFILHQQGDDKTALVWMEKVKDQPYAKTADFMSLYAVLLDNNGRQPEALQVAENAAGSNKATPEIIALLKKQYIKEHGNENGFEAHFQGMKNAEQLSAEQEALRAELIRKEAPAFKLEQLSGGMADLNKQKGKIVVIDFWATWCGPCKEAMAGMQMAVNKYSQDKNVDFYFIATQESRPDYREQIKKFLQTKNFHMNVLLDAKSPSSGHLDDTYNKYTKTLQFSGIPAKVIIDRHGMIRWLGTGYKGSPSALADEISYIIELLKKEG